MPEENYMEEENNELPKEYQSKGKTKNWIIIAFIILIILVIIWAYFTGRLAPGGIG